MSGWPWTEASPQLLDGLSGAGHWRKVSIVTPSYNQGQFIEETIRSVLLQGYPDLEYIVIDGGSTDNTKEILQKYHPWFTYYCSEPDGGQADALNKGFAKASGMILGYLNSDDVYEKSAIQRLGLNYLCPENEKNLMVYPVEDFGCCIPVTYLAQPNHTPQSLLTGETSLHQPGVFWSRLAWSAVSGFDVSYRYCFDRKFFMQILIEGFQLNCYTGPVLAKFRWHDQSKTYNETELGFIHEIDRLAKEIGWEFVRAGLLTKNEWGAILSIRRQLAMSAMRYRISHEADSLRQTWRCFFELLHYHPDALLTRFFWGSVKDSLRSLLL